MTKTERFLNALEQGAVLTCKQAQARFGLTQSGVTSVVQNLRSYGYPIYTNKRVNGPTKYRLGTPTKSVVAAGYAALGAN